MSFYILKKNIYEFEIEKSKFISIVSFCSSVEEMKTQIALIKDSYPKASHYVYALRCDETSRSSDDGEPSGTAGKPILELIHKLDLNNVLIVVVRYFGGTKLGAGRLLRSYFKSAKENIDKCKKYIKEECYFYNIEIMIPKVMSLKNFCALNNINVDKIIYNIDSADLTLNSFIHLEDTLENLNAKIIEFRKDFAYKEVV